ncbi:polysaccharide deacetylase family protein [Stenotrophomonas sp.]|uniref:polysaccharide deacetylase family protein n=1 Tax=Stenotrophomonas sp. TaxID=69392 RepID=UPI0028A7931E|nr:polysaccharide deacetylase family protein [Stenotrophomonas sp.]
MRIGFLRSGVLALLCLAGVAHAAAPDRRIALTIDDLPWQRLDERAEPELAVRHAQLMAALKQADVPVVGFVNEAKLEVDGQVQPARVQMLRDWRDAGFELGNHTFGHVDLHAMTLEAYEQDILRGEATLRPLLAETGQAPRWFRHPYLHAGQTPEKRAALGVFLAQHGYRIAPVTIDNSEWIWAFAYDHVRETETDPATRDARLRQLRRGYVPYMLTKLDYYEQRSQQLLGRLPAQVWLIHANALTADCVEELVAATRRRGYRFISLDTALQDPAYQRADGYNGGSGISWIQRWAMAGKAPKSFYADEPRVPGWVMTLAGREGE